MGSPANPERWERAAKLRAAGCSFDAIAADIGISRQRAHQLVQKHEARTGREAYVRLSVERGTLESRFPGAADYPCSRCRERKVPDAFRLIHGGRKRHSFCRKCESVDRADRLARSAGGRADRV